MGTTVAFWGILPGMSLLWFIGSQLGRTIGFFPPLATTIASFSTKKFSSWGRGSQVSSSLNLLSPASEVYDAFRNRNMSSPSGVGGGQPWSTAIAYIV